MGINKKDIRIKELYDRKFKLAVIARKLGFEGNSITAGTERVKEGLKKMGIKNIREDEKA